MLLSGSPSWPDKGNCNHWDLHPCGWRFKSCLPRGLIWRQQWRLLHPAISSWPHRLQTPLWRNRRMQRNWIPHIRQMRSLDSTGWNRGQYLGRTVVPYPVAPSDEACWFCATCWFHKITLFVGFFEGLVGPSWHKFCIVLCCGMLRKPSITRVTRATQTAN